MVLPDTCVWILSFSGRDPYKKILDDLLARDEVVGHDLVYGEVLIGDNGGRKNLLSDYRLLEHIPTVAHEEVILLAEARKLNGVGLRWIDAHLLASALISRSKLWTADESLNRVAKSLDVAYR